MNGQGRRDGNGRKRRMPGREMTEKRDENGPVSVRVLVLRETPSGGLLSLQL